MNIDWTEIIIAICTVLITGVLVPLIRAAWLQKKSEMTQEQQETVRYWTEVGVRWAKQWLSGETGEKKKAEVMAYVSDKLMELGIKVSAADLDKIIGAVYEQVKKEVNGDANV